VKAAVPADTDGVDVEKRSRGGRQREFGSKDFNTRIRPFFSVRRSHPPARWSTPPGAFLYLSIRKILRHARKTPRKVGVPKYAAAGISLMAGVRPVRRWGLRGPLPIPATLHCDSRVGAAWLTPSSNEAKLDDQGRGRAAWPPEIRPMTRPTPEPIDPQHLWPSMAVGPSRPTLRMRHPG
jgi:hypothetical protein